MGFIFLCRYEINKVHGIINGNVEVKATKREITVKTIDECDDIAPRRYLNEEIKRNCARRPETYIEPRFLCQSIQCSQRIHLTDTKVVT